MKKILITYLALLTLIGCDYGLRPDDPMRSKQIEYEYEAFNNELLEERAKEAAKNMRGQNPALFTFSLNTNLEKVYKRFIVNNAILENNPEHSTQLGRAIGESLAKAFTVYGSARQVNLSLDDLALATIEGKTFASTNKSASELAASLGGDVMIIPSYRVEGNSILIHLNAIRVDGNQPVMQYAYRVLLDNTLREMLQKR